MYFMTYLRRYRRRIGTFLAVLFLATSAMPAALEAAQGVDLQAPICSPDGTKYPDRQVPSGAAESHCQICPIGGMEFATIVPPETGHEAVFARKTADIGVLEPVSTVKRAELAPLNGRAPPIQS